MEGSDNFYHVCTNGLSKNLMFKGDEDFVSGMNDVPACGVSSGVQIYCFCLMDNHVHFVLRGSYSACLMFARQYKRLRSRSLGMLSGESRLDGAEISVIPVSDDEYLLNVIAYVMRNPVAAGVSVMPGEYPWSSSFLYFGNGSFRYRTGRRLSEIPVRERRALLRSRVSYPDDYILQDDGMVFPGSYVRYREVEKMFGSPKRLLYYLSRNMDYEMEIRTGIVAKARYRDVELTASLDALSQEIFGKIYSRIGIEDRIRIARELRKRYGAPVSQVARVAGLDVGILRVMNI